MRRLVIPFTFVATLIGCVDGPTRRPGFGDGAPSKLIPAGKQSPSGRAPLDPAVELERQRARRMDLERRAWAALALDAYPKAAAESIVRDVSLCPTCTEKNAVRMKESRTAVYVGMALNLTQFGSALDFSGQQVRLDKAEKFVVEAEESAAIDGPARKARADALIAEHKVVDTALVRCEKNQAPCSDECKAGTGTSCVAIGFMLISRQEYGGAKELFKQACDAGSVSGCDWLEKADVMQYNDERRAREAWLSFQEIGDALATKKYLYAFASQNFSGRRATRAMENMALDIQTYTRDTFCPALKDYVAMASAPELKKNAADHCANDPPTAAGSGGAEVALTTECRAVYATTCGP